MISSSSQLDSAGVARLVKQIQSAQSILLTTHRECDGDGLGAALALYHGLKKMNKSVRALMVDDVPKKYRFLEPERYLQTYNKPHDPIHETDLTLIFDTNDRRLVEPLYSVIEAKSRQILFVDHHPVLNQGPEPTAGSFIDTSAASTGEIAYFVLKGLKIRLDKDIARALYTSLAFDTQLFRYVKNSPTTHLICAELLEYEHNAQEVHRHLFATLSQQKVAYLAKVLGQVEYHSEGRIAVVFLSLADRQQFSMDMDDSRDVIDMIMNIQPLQAAALVREEAPNTFKISVRSKGHIEVLGIAESFGGGGHMYASGAYISGKKEDIMKSLTQQLINRLDGHSEPRR